MVSAEGACAAYYAYGRHLEREPEEVAPFIGPLSPIGPMTQNPPTVSESFRDKILRKCRESVEMKQKFFAHYAEQIEAMSREMAMRFHKARSCWSWAMAAACATRCILASNLPIRLSRSAAVFRSSL